MEKERYGAWSTTEKEIRRVQFTGEETATGKKLYLFIKKYFRIGIVSKTIEDSVVDPLYATGLFLYPLKKSGKQKFFDVFRGYRKRLVALNGLRHFCHKK